MSIDTRYTTNFVLLDQEDKYIFEIYYFVSLRLSNF